VTSNEFFAPLIERELDAIPAAARAFAAERGVEGVAVAVARFAVIAHSTSQHGKRAVVAARSLFEVREEMGDRWFDMVVECARYASESRQPWSEPPIFEPPKPGERKHVSELRAALVSKDRRRAERWLAARLEDADDDLRIVATGDALLLLETVAALEKVVGDTGRWVLLRLVIEELLADPGEVTERIEQLIDRAIERRGSVDAVGEVFVRHAGMPPSPRAESWIATPALQPYRLARDYAQTLIAHGIARTLPARADEFLAAVHHNLEHGESFAEWSFA
jgi:hypothetical protein